MALTCRDVCKPLPLFLFFWELRVTTAANLKQNYCFLRPIRLRKHTISCCWWKFLGLLKDCTEPAVVPGYFWGKSVIQLLGSFKKNGSDQKIKVIQKVQETSLLCIYHLAQTEMQDRMHQQTCGTQLNCWSEVPPVRGFQASFGIYSLYPFLHVRTWVLRLLAQFRFIFSPSPCEKAGARLPHFFLLCLPLCPLSLPNIVTKRSWGARLFCMSSCVSL